MENAKAYSFAEEIRAVKSLLILQALALGCQQKHVAAALGVSEATLSRMFPKGFAKEIANIAERRIKSVSGAQS
jgi:DNA-binding transcriptional regulator YdaS (Cro superfamily)